MSDVREGGSSSTLRRLARRAAADQEERCDLCGEPITPKHRHLLDLSSRELSCLCRACALLFDRSAAGAGVRRLVPTRYRSLPDFDMSDELWEGLRIPVNMAFFSYNTAAARVMALYPSPMGPTESLLPLDVWSELESKNPILAGLEPDVEALLVNRVRGSRESFVVPIDECYRLVGIIRTHWRGLSGGREVWKEIESFFTELKLRARPPGPPDA